MLSLYHKELSEDLVFTNICTVGVSPFRLHRELNLPFPASLTIPITAPHGLLNSLPEHRELFGAGTGPISHVRTGCDGEIQSLDPTAVMEVEKHQTNTTGEKKGNLLHILKPGESSSPGAGNHKVIPVNIQANKSLLGR